MEMEVKSIEIRINEMMEIEDWAGEDDDEWVVDRYGDQVMPQAELMMVTEEEGDMEANVCMDVTGLDITQGEG